MPTDQELILATLDSIHAKLAGLVKRADKHTESLQILRNAVPATEHAGNQAMILNRLAYLTETLKALRDEILNLRDQSSIAVANLHHLASRIDALQMLLPAYDTPPHERQQNVTNAAGERQHVVDPIT